jgi:hypothetical protein
VERGDESGQRVDQETGVRAPELPARIEQVAIDADRREHRPGQDDQSLLAGAPAGIAVDLDEVMGVVSRRREDAEDEDGAER